MASPTPHPEDQVQQFKDFLMNYNKLTEMCFNDCVHDFTVRTVRDKEDKCSAWCMDKYLKMNLRIMQRVQEFQMLANEATPGGGGAPAAGKM